MGPKVSWLLWKACKKGEIHYANICSFKGGKKPKQSLGGTEKLKMLL